MMQGSLKLKGPSLAHWFGTDQFGRDVLSRVVRGAGSTFLIGVGTTLIGGIGGMILGAVTGYFGGWLDEILMRVNDAAAAFPSVLLALVMISLWGSGTYKVMLALGIAFIPSFARIVRGEFMRLRESDYVISARLIGVKTPRILFVHILPNILPALLSALAIGFNNAVLAEAGMSYLGIGVLVRRAVVRGLSGSVSGTARTGRGIARRGDPGSVRRWKIMLQVDRLSIHFADREEVQEVVRGISFSVQDGEIVGIVGESGSGKTMTALTIAGLFKEHAVLDAGTIRLDGTDLLKLTEREMRQVQGNRIGMIFQEPMTALNPTMKIGRQVEEVLRLHTDLDSRARKAAVIRALEEVELDEAEKLLFKYPHELSGGMRQRVMIAAAMICRPSLLIADEPTTALDAATQESILKLLKKLNDKYGMSILFISHNLRVVKELCTRVFVMKDGEILEEGETEVVFQNPKTEYTKALIAAIPARVGENPYYEMLKQKAGRQYD